MKVAYPQLNLLAPDFGIIPPQLNLLAPNFGIIPQSSPLVKRALTIKEPWVSSILYHGKNIENRSWKIPQGYLNEPIAIHTAKQQSTEGLDFIKGLGISLGDSLPLGHIVAIVKFTECSFEGSQSPWGMKDHYHWKIEVSRILKNPIPATGKLGLWSLSPESLELVNA